MTTRVLWGVAVASALLLAVGARLDVGANDAAPTPVLVAKQLIPTGTPGERVFAREMYARTTVPLRQVEVGAIANPAYLRGHVSATDVLPGQQLTASGFTVVSGVHKVSLTSPLRAGDFLSLTVLVAPRARCTFTTVVGGYSSTTLDGKVGGRITWRQRVEPRTPPGRLWIIVSCGASGTLGTSIRVLPR